MSRRSLRRLLVLLLVLAVLLPLGAGCRKGKTAPAGPTVNPADPFEDITQTSGIHWTNRPLKKPMRLLESVGFGAGFVDFDRDGHLDVFLAGAPACALYRNQGNQTFQDVTEKAGLGTHGDWIGCATCDYDNDGWPDLYVTGYLKSTLYRNRGDGTFEDVTLRSGVAMPGRWATAATFADFDRDGWADLYVGTYCRFGPKDRQYCVLHANGVKTACRPIDYEPQIGRCFRNRGDGTFEDVTQRWGLAGAHGKTLGAVVADYDSDGWPDLYLANDEMLADLFHNERGKGFKNVSVETATAYGESGRLMGGMGVDWGDYDNDSRLDLAVGTFEGEAKVLFHNLGKGGFEFASPQAGILAASYQDVVFGTLLFDYDNDSWLDLLFVNGHTMDNITEIRPTLTYRQPARLFHNRKDGTFALASSPALETPIAGRAVACADFANEGWTGLLVADMDGPVRLLKNASPRGAHWLQVSLRGTRSNRDALGAQVRITANGVKRVDEVRTSRSYLSACDPRIHFGLGTVDRVEEVEIRWPSGAVTRLRDVPADQVLEVTEDGASHQAAGDKR